ncbi:RluA family pseudouridine synthase [Candidatus Peregrinibacteria bacterium]|nr:RluA family pseudouridine synthase [Candidatus Peregrinibacteria bacterium]
MQKIILQVNDLESSQRLDKYVADKHSDISRSYIQKLAKDGYVKVNGDTAKASFLIREGDEISLVIKEKNIDIKPKDIPLNVIFENEDILIINKPANLVVHQGAHGAHAEDSLVNALLYYLKDNLSSINGVKRPGIIHRLDKDTSGLLLIAKNNEAHAYLADLFMNKQIKKEYIALVKGRLEHFKGIIKAPIGRDSNDRKKMGIVSENAGKMAETHYEIADQFNDSTLVKVNLITGRTHQIRVHFASIGHPVIGDGTYGDKSINKKYKNEYGLNRQFLHAKKLTFRMPGNKKETAFEADLSKDLNKVIKELARL